MTMLNGAETDRPLAICSVSVTVQLAVPNLSALGVKLRRPVVFTAGATANRLAPELQLTVKANGSDSPGPEEMLVAQAALYAPESSATVTAAPAVKEGGSFTAIKHNMCVSCTHTLIGTQHIMFDARLHSRVRTYKDGL
jgi:hypothetical protein